MRILLVCALSVLLQPSSLRGDTLIYAARMIDGVSDDVRQNVTLVVQDGKISEIRDGFSAGAADDKVIDLREYSVLPGLIDLHTHLMSQHSRESYTERFFMEEADYALRSTMYARSTLMAGFTTVRELGDNGINSVALRRAIDSGWAVGPRIYTAGKSLATTGGHADPTNGLRGDFRQDADPVRGVINGPDEARKAVRQRYKDGADLIKLTATGGVLSLAANGQNPQFTDEELRAIVETARDYGMAVAVHAHGAEGMKRAVLAGVDSIEHGTYMTDEIMALMKERGTVLVPTLMAGEWVALKAEEDGYFPEIVRPKAAAIGPVMRDTFRRAVQAGVPIAFGTDSGVSVHGENAREFELMVDGGMTPMQAIQCATTKAAKLLRVDDQLGSLQPGMAADVIAVAGDPLQEIRRMKEIVFVMKAGKVFRKPQDP